MLGRRRPDDYRPLGPRQRRLIVVLAVVTALGVVWLMLERPGAPPRPARSPVPACAPGQTSGCVGGKTELLAPAAPASAAR